MLYLASLSFSNLSVSSLKDLLLALKLKAEIDQILTRLVSLASVQAASAPNIQIDIFPLSPSHPNIFRFLHSSQNIEFDLPSSIISTFISNYVAAAAYHVNILTHLTPKGYISASALLTLDLYRQSEKVEVNHS